MLECLHNKCIHPITILDFPSLHNKKQNAAKMGVLHIILAAQIVSKLSGCTNYSRVYQSLCMSHVSVTTGDAPLLGAVESNL